MNRLGVVFPDRAVPLRAQRDRVRMLADLGYTDLWAGESDGADAVTPLATAAGWGTPLRLGTAVLSVFTRPPALLAMTAATLADAAGGNFVLGVGASSKVIVERWNALAFDQPLARSRDVVCFLRRALAGERIDERFETFAVRGFTLARPPEPAPPVYLGALRPAMLHLASEVADGVVLTSLGAGDVATLRPYLAPGKEVVAWVTVCPTSDASSVRAAARMRLASYLAMPSYGAYHDWLGRRDALAPMRRALRDTSGFRSAAAAIPDAVVDDLVVHGSPDACREHLARFFDAGVDTVLLEVLPDVMDAGAALRALAPG